jgi:hypothetical protein
MFNEFVFPQLAIMLIISIAWRECFEVFGGLKTALQHIALSK